MTEIQQGANRAIAPEIMAARTDPPKKMLLLMTSHTFHAAAGHIPPSPLSPTARSARPAPFVSLTGYCLSLRHDRDFGALDLGDLASDDLLPGQQARS